MRPGGPTMFRHTAHIYDLLYEATGKDYARESTDLHRLIEQRRPGARTLLDVACGTGGHLRHLGRWYDVTGVDLDPGMLDQARGRLPDVRLVEADMRTLALDASFDAVGAMARHLTPGGVLIVDGWVRPDAWISGGTTEATTATSEQVTVVRMSRSRRQGDRTYLDMHHLIGTPDGIEHVVDHHELTLFAPVDYETAFRASGLVVDTVESPMPGRDRYVAVTAS